MDDFSAPLPPFKSSALRTFQSVFESPNWGINLLWLTLAALAQSIFVGQIGLLGWGAEQIDRRAGRPETPLPDIDSNRLGDYISKGLWPFCVYFVVQIVGSLVIVMPVLLFLFLVAAVVGEAGNDVAPVLAVFVIMPVSLILSILLGVITVPFVIRSMVCQSFSEAFDIAWVREFIRLMFWEIVWGGLAFALLSLAVIVAGFLLLCIGYIPALGVVSGAGMNLLAQWYEVFLSRGGIPVPSPATDDSIIDATIV